MYYRRQWQRPPFPQNNFMDHSYNPYQWNQPPFKQQQIPYQAWMPQQPMNPPGGFGGYPNVPKQQPFQTIMNNFKKEDGQLDFDKMFGTVNQVSQTFKQISPLFALFKK